MKRTGAVSSGGLEEGESLIKDRKVYSLSSNGTLAC